MNGPGQGDAGPLYTDGRYFTYVFPCAWEDFCKIGFSRDPLGRIASLHPRWYEFFDLDGGGLVEAETQRDARDLELELRRPLKLHRAPAPLTIVERAGGKTEWVRGANALLDAAIHALAARGHRTWPLRAWLRAVMLERLDRLYDWSAAQLPQDDDPRALHAVAARALRDVLDGHLALDIDPAPCLPAHVLDWYRRTSGWPA